MVVIKMATKMKFSRKPCKLDAICEKLQQISSNEGKIVTSNGIIKAAENTVETVNESPTDLKCHNNNIIGKADMNSIEETLKELRNTKLNQENAVRDMKRKLFVNDANGAEIRQDVKIGKMEISKQNICVKSEYQKTAKIGSSHRKSRKSSLPRSISQVRDHYNHVEDYNGELTEFECNNQNTKPADKHEVKYANKSLSPIDNLSDYDSDVGVPLDLSVNRTKDNDSVINGDLTSEYDSEVDDEIEDDEDFHPDRNLVIDEDISLAKSDVSSNTSGKYSGNEHVAHLKDFAENTMNELISMYGFSSSGQQVDLSKHIPIQNFRNNLLQFTYGGPSPNSISTFENAQCKNQSVSSSDDDDEEDDGGDDESCDGSTSLMSFYSPSGKVQYTGKLQNDRFTSSSSFINAIYSTGVGQDVRNGPFMSGLPNYSKYMKRYNNGSECGSGTCKDLGYKEHFHCIDCSFQVFIKKEEMVRHYKWHRKREESLQHGFLRFSPLDDCSKRFGPCTHNGKQTHYHCLQGGCDKVYISTSDVQMHANYHRKDSAIMSEGFQRFRATEDCGTLSCAFYGQRTTHFHCLRSNCKFTFKNKADMEKHKSYHQKDEVLSRDGFKKFMKYEHCMYHGCLYSKVSNHIHCIRSGCDYVLHSTAQLYSHKRKHERKDFENAYKKYKDISQPTCTPNKLILPKADFRYLAGTSTSNGTPFIQTIAGLKRLADWDQTEPLALKKPKVEPHSDIDASLQSTPSTRSTPALSSTPEEIAKTEEPMDDSSRSSVDSVDSCQSVKQHLSMDEDIEESLNLNESLKLPIPKFMIKNPSSPVLSPMQAPKFSAMRTPTSMVSSSYACISSSMPGTLGASLVSMNPGTLLTVPSIVPGALTALQPPKTVYTERREKDDSWKTYLVRYTANDPCNPHCQYLYKDHYHCKIDGCLVLFKSKDGVREHARFHELQDRITPIAYQTYETDELCPESCQYSEKEKHYHCIWTGCTHVVPYVGPTFGRLEHYRIHEYSRAAAGKSYNRSVGKSGTVYEDSSMKRRGRPPKYPKIELPRIPKVELSDEEIRQSQLLARDFKIASQMKVINGFRVFTPNDPCPDDQCSYNGKLHYHCARPRCFTITDRVDVLNLHAKDFHSFVKILEGYEYFDRNVSCRRLHCQNNQANHHFHCMRPKCDYSFIRHSTMTQHEKKHQCTGSSSTSLSPPAMLVPISAKPHNQDNSSKVAVDVTSPMGSPTNVITSAAAFLSLCSLKQAQNSPIFFPHPVTQVTSLSQGTVILTPKVGLQAGNHPPILPQGISPIILPVSTVQASVAMCSTLSGLPTSVVVSSPVTINAFNSSNVAGPSMPLAVLLQGGMNQIPQPSWNDLRSRMHYAIAQNCGRPFCKLKKKDHYHCLDCNQAFSDPVRLRSHIGRHGVKFKQTESINHFLTQNTNLVSPQIDLKSSKTLKKKDKYDLDLEEAECLTDAARRDSYESDKEDVESSSLNLYPSTFSEMISKAQEQNKMSSDDDSSISNRDIENNEDDDENDECNLKIDTGMQMEDGLSDSDKQAVDISSRSGRKIIKTKHEGFMNSENINLTKKQQNSTPKGSNLKNLKSFSLPQKGPTVGTRGMRDDSIPDGYSRWRYNEECKYQKCAYRHSVTHFHCIRDDCGYGFSDRSRLLQHTLRHGRIDSITGGEFQQYRINQDCENVNCEYNNKMSHYHCKRCSYSCTDSSKVLTHRKHHTKMDNIMSQGFQKYLAMDDCGISLCPYTRKQNHFHCVIESCKASVLGPTQMASHKLKHTNE